MRELSSGPETHRFRAPGSPAAERREGHWLSAALLQISKEDYAHEKKLASRIFRQNYVVLNPVGEG